MPAAAGTAGFPPLFYPVAVEVVKDYALNRARGRRAHGDGNRCGIGQSARICHLIDEGIDSDKAWGRRVDKRTGLGAGDLHGAVRRERGHSEIHRTTLRIDTYPGIVDGDIGQRGEGQIQAGTEREG